MSIKYITIVTFKVIIVTYIINVKLISSEMIYKKCQEKNNEQNSIFCIGVKSNSTTYDPFDESSCLFKSNCDVLIQAVRTEEELFTWLLYAQTNDKLHNAIRFSIFNEESRTSLTKPLKSGDVIIELSDDPSHTTENLTCAVKKVAYDANKNSTSWLPMNSELEQSVTFKFKEKFEYVSDDSNSTNYTLCMFESTLILNEGEIDTVDLLHDLSFYLDHMQRTFSGQNDSLDDDWTPWTRENYIRTSPIFKLWHRSKGNKGTKSTTTTTTTTTAELKNDEEETNSESTSESTTMVETETVNEESIISTSGVQYESLESNSLPENKGEKVTTNSSPINEISEQSTQNESDNNEQHGKNSKTITTDEEEEGEGEYEDDSEFEDEEEEVVKVTQKAKEHNEIRKNSSNISHHHHRHNHTNTESNDIELHDDSLLSEASFNLPDLFGMKSMHLLFWSVIAILIVLSTIIALVFCFMKKKNRQSVSISLAGKQINSTHSLSTTASSLN